ncbi:right-handed parallel beta-helix repeat-containing protein [Halococcoides cellulosivorans]|nr:right-handed parallel beta-helix repeat-containing protein [Halococcoides cellulosivorans]
MEWCRPPVRADRSTDLNSGVMSIDAPIRLDDDHASLVGDGTVLKPTYEGPAVVVEGCTSAFVSGLIVEHIGGEATEKANGIEVRDATDTRIEHCQIRDTPRIGEPGTNDAIGGGSGICVASDARGTIIRDCATVDCGWRGIEVGGTQTRIERCRSRGQVDRGVSGDVQYPGVDPEFDAAASQLVIRNSTFEGGPHPAAPIGFTGARQVLVDDCFTTTESGRRGVAARNSDQVTIRNSHFVGGGPDPQDGIFSSSDGTKIVDNDICGFEFGVRASGRKTIISENVITECEYPIIDRKDRSIRRQNNLVYDRRTGRTGELIKRIRLLSRRF